MNENSNDILPEYDFSRARRGPVVKRDSAERKTRITIRLDNEILDWFRQQVHQQGGGSYQALINQALHEYIESQHGSWEDTMRRVVREELQQAGYRLSDAAG
jgi:uncharacterized protein (DUF4415 family)